MYNVPEMKNVSNSYCVPEKSSSNLYGNLLHKMGQEFLDIQYIVLSVKGPSLTSKLLLANLWA